MSGYNCQHSLGSWTLFNILIKTRFDAESSYLSVCVVFICLLTSTKWCHAKACSCVWVCLWVGGYWFISYKTLFLFCFLSMSASMSWNWAKKCLSAPAAALVQLIAIDQRPLGRDLPFSALTGRCLRLLTALGGYFVSHRGCLCLLRNAWDT